MEIFITSSWLNRHAVEMLEFVLVNQGDHFKVTSFVMDNDHEYSAIGENKNLWAQSVDYGEWANSEEGENVFQRDLTNIKNCDVLVLIEPAGRDAWAHVGMAHILGKKIIALNSRGRKVGLMRRLALWFRDYIELLEYLSTFAASPIITPLSNIPHQWSSEY